MKAMYLQIEEIEAIPNRIIANKTTSRHIIVKILETIVTKKNKR